MLENTEQNMYKASSVILEMHIRTCRKYTSVLQKIRSDVHVHVSALEEEFNSFLNKERYSSASNIMTFSLLA